MRLYPLVAFVLFSLGLAAAPARADEEARLIEAINAYRGQVQMCAGKGTLALPPLQADPRLQLPAGGSGDLQQALLGGRMGNWQAEGQQLLARINSARSQARRCGGQAFEASAPLAWSNLLGASAEAHSRAMANGNFFDHRDRDGRTPGDRAELAGYAGSRIGENIAAGLDTPQRVVEGWLASPAHCANLMNPQFRELGAAYAVDPRSDAGIYWTALFGAP